MANWGSSRQKEIVFISLDSDDDEEVYDEVGGVSVVTVSPSSASSVFDSTQNMFGGVLDVNKLSEPVLRSIVASIIKVPQQVGVGQQPVPESCENCDLLKSSMQKLEDEQEVDRGHLRMLEDENSALRKELEKEKKERAHLEHKLGQMATNLRTIQEVTGNIQRSLVEEVQEMEQGQEEPISDSYESLETPPPPQQVEPQPNNYDSLLENMLPHQPQPRFHFHAVDKFKSHLGIYCICGLKFESRNKVYEHVKKMMMKRKPIVKAPFSCTHCPKKFSKFVSLKHHTMKKHGLRFTAGVVGCHYCGQVFQTRNKLIYHQKIVHKEGHPRFLSWYRARILEAEARQANNSDEEVIVVKDE